MTTGDKNQETPAKIRWGAHFKATREAMHLSEKEVASRLHLNPNIITLIEAESFKGDTPAIFMRGYLRSYARLLNISDKHINQALSDLGLADTTAGKATPIMKNKKPRVDTNSSNAFTLWSTSLVVLVLVGLVGMWWNTHTPHITSDTPDTTTTAMATQNVTPAPNATPTDPTPKELAGNQTETPEPVTPAAPPQTVSANPAAAEQTMASGTEQQQPPSVPAQAPVTATNNGPTTPAAIDPNMALSPPMNIPEASNAPLGTETLPTTDPTAADGDQPKKHIARNHRRNQDNEDMIPDSGLLPEPGLELDSNDTN